MEGGRGRAVLAAEAQNSAATRVDAIDARGGEGGVMTRVFEVYHYIIIIYLVYDEMQNLSFAAACENVVAGLRTAVAHQKVSVALGHDLLGFGPRNAPVVPGVRPQVPRVQTQLPFQQFLRPWRIAIRLRRLLWFEGAVIKPTEKFVYYINIYK